MFDELASVSTPQGSKTYAYDAFGRLARERTTTGSTTVSRSLYHDGQHLVSEATGGDGNNIVNWYTHSDQTDDVLAITPQLAAPANFTVFPQPSQTKHYSVHTDHQGSVRAITDLGGIVINSYAYDAYGNAEEAVEGLAQRFRYTGREWDDFAGLYHYRARTYDAETGRFLQEDPIGFDAGDLNVYRYVGNNPVNATDPSGMFSNEGGTFTAAVSGPLMVGRMASTINLLTAAGTAAYLNSEEKNALSAVGAELNCKFHQLASLVANAGNGANLTTNDKCGSQNEEPPACIDIEGGVWQIGEIGYRYDPMSRAHWPYLDGNHTHYGRVQQIPHNGDCFWQPDYLPVTEGPPPAGMRRMVNFR